MGCLAVTYSRIGGMEAAVLREGGMTALADRKGDMCALTGRVGGIEALIERQGHFEASAALVCAVSKKAAIKVRPVETQWVDVGLEAYYDIVYPKEWRIE